MGRSTAERSALASPGVLATRSERIGIVVPCHNEAGRLDVAAFAQLAGRPGVGVHFVDDGSTDTTAHVLDEVARLVPASVRVQRLDRNVGKAEAVRRGLLAAIEAGAELVGYLDADLATSPEDFMRLARAATDNPELVVVLGSRVGLLGHEVDRTRRRHYLGRVFATAASLVLRLRVYDTQNGAKLFRTGLEVADALSVPFASRWAFDVELLGRLARGRAEVAGLEPDRMLEIPVLRWRDVEGSHLKPVSSLRTALDLVVVSRRLRRWR